MFINWDDTVLHFNEIPVYGNYGGPLWTAGEVGGTTPQLPANGDPFSVDPKPVDNLDAAFYLHDLAYNVNPGATADNDFALLQTIDSLQFTDPSAPDYGGDAEASLYAGATSLALIGRLAITPGALNQLDAAEVSALPNFTADAIQNFEVGLASVPDEGRAALHAFEANYLPQIGAQFDLLI